VLTHSPRPPPLETTTTPPNTKQKPTTTPRHEKKQNKQKTATTTASAAAATTTQNARRSLLQQIKPPVEILERGKEVQRPVVSDYAILIGNVGPTALTNTNNVIFANLPSSSSQASAPYGSKHMAVISNRTAVAVNGGGVARAESTARAWAYEAPSTAIANAKAIAQKEARAVARATSDNIGLPGTTTTAVANAIAKSIDANATTANFSINGGSRRRGLNPAAYASGRSDVRGWAGIAVGGNTNIASANRGMALALGRTRGAQGSFGGTNNGYFSLNQGIGGSVAVATSQLNDAVAQTTVRLNSDVGQTVTGALSVATAGGTSRSGGNMARASADSRAKTDFGPAASGSINIAASPVGRAQSSISANRAITRAGPVAVAGSIDVISAYNNAFIGDYTVLFPARGNDEEDGRRNPSGGGGQTVSGAQFKQRDETTATANTIGDAYAVAIRLANSKAGEAQVRNSRGTPSLTSATANDGNVGAFSLEEVTGYQNAEARASTQTLTTTGQTYAQDVQVLQSLEDTFGSQVVNSESIEGNSAGIGLQASTISEYGNLIQQVGSTTVLGNSLANGWQSTFAGMTGENAQSVNAGSDRGAALAVATNLVGAALTSEAVTSSAATTQFGTSTAVGIAATAAGIQAQSDAAVASATSLGDAYSLAVASGLALVDSQVAAGSASATEVGNSVSTAIGLATGAIQADARAAATSGVALKGNSIASANALSVSHLFSNSTANAAATTGEGLYVEGKARATSLSLVKSTSNARSDATTTKETGGTGSTVSEASALSVGFLADATAIATAKNPEKTAMARGNAVALGVVSRVSTGGDSKVALGPAQALTGGVSLSAPKPVVAAVQDAAAAGGEAAAGGAAAPAPAADAAGKDVGGKLSGLVGALRAVAQSAKGAAITA